MYPDTFIGKVSETFSHVKYNHSFEIFAFAPMHFRKDLTL